MVFHLRTSLQCVSAGGVAITPGGFGGQGDKSAVPEAACRPADPLTIAVSAGGWRDGSQKDPFPPNIPRCAPPPPPPGGLAPGGSGHTHTTRRQIIQDTILQPPAPGEPHRRAPGGRSRGPGRGDLRRRGAGGLSDWPRRRRTGRWGGRPGPEEPLGAGGRAPAQRPPPGSYGAGPHVQPRRTGSAAPGVWAASRARASGSLGRRRPHRLGAEFATHLKVARNRDLPNPGPPRTAQARSGPRGGARSGGAACALKGGDPPTCGRGPWWSGCADREVEGMGSEDKMVEQVGAGGGGGGSEGGLASRVSGLITGSPLASSSPP